MADPRDSELTFVLEDEAAEDTVGTQRPEFDEIPPRLRAEVERELADQAYELLHAEAVERGEVGSPPAAAAAAPARLMRILLLLAVGGTGGAAAVLAATALLRWVTATLR
jgi:hypothetical protein